MLFLSLIGTAMYASEHTATAPAQIAYKDLSGAGLIMQLHFEALCDRAIHGSPEAATAIRELLRFMNDSSYVMSSRSQQILVAFRLLSDENRINRFIYKIVQMPHIQQTLKLIG